MLTGWRSILTYSQKTHEKGQDSTQTKRKTSIRPKHLTDAIL
jgi:hypothetical protein